MWSSVLKYDERNISIYASMQKYPYPLTKKGILHVRLDLLYLSEDLILIGKLWYDKRWGINAFSLFKLFHSPRREIAFRNFF